MTSSLASVLQRGRALLTPKASSDILLQSGAGQQSFQKATEEVLFSKVDPAVDGEDCDHDCESCEIRYPAKWKIDESQDMYGHVHGWATHLLVATGKTDWKRNVEDEKGSVMEAIGKYGKDPSNGKLMLSASDIPVPETDHDRQSSPSLTPTSVLLLPAFTIIENVTPNSVVDLIQDYISTSPTNTTPLSLPAVPNPPRLAYPIPTSTPPPDLSRQDGCPPSLLVSRPCPHKYLILLCSQRSRDARCGQSAPLLRREFERHLRPLGLYRDLYDERPGGVGIYFISHVGGHKFAANVMIYRRQAADNNTKAKREGTSEDEQIARKIKDLAIAGKSDVIKDMGEAGQCIWLARVRPEDCEGIIKFTVLQGKVVKPERQLRGGFDREKGLVSW